MGGRRTGLEEGRSMEFMLVLFEDPDLVATDEQRKEAVERVGEYAMGLLSDGTLKGGAPLHPVTEAKRIRTRERRAAGPDCLRCNRCQRARMGWSWAPPLRRRQRHAARPSIRGTAGLQVGSELVHTAVSGQWAGSRGRGRGQFRRRPG
jgi:hypothetical protein